MIESIPSERRPVVFKLADDLISDERTHQYWYPSLARHREQRLTHDDFKRINRDYCSLQSPGKTSWQSKESQQSLQMGIFHTDTVIVPKKGSESFLSRWHLQDMTRANVDKIFKRYFGLSIPLSAESPAYQWVPGCVVYNVEIEPDVWENRVALFFDGNVENSVCSMRYRVSSMFYDQVITRKMLGEKYLDIWRSRWQDKSSILNLAVGQPRTKPMEHLVVGIQNVLAVKPSTDMGESMLRGRQKKRDRRRKKVRRGLSEVRDDLDGESAMKSINLETSISLSLTVPVADFTNDSLPWQYSSGEIGIQNRNSGCPVKLSIQFGSQIHSNRPDDEMTMKRNSLDRIPQIVIVHVDKHAPRLAVPLRFRIMSTNRRAAQVLPSNSSNTSTDLVLSQEPDQTSGMSTSPNHKNHIADLVDEAGFVGLGNWPDQSYTRSSKVDRSKGFISMFEADPLSLISMVPKPSLLSRSEYDGYWHKFFLVCGTGGSFRAFPYSYGYGIQHNIPRIVRRENRWGYLDVDNMMNATKKVIWRADWEFDLNDPNSEQCKCLWTEVDGAIHDVKTCKSIIKEKWDWLGAGCGGGPFMRHHIPNEILSNVLAFVNRPYEELQQIEDWLHRYRRPYIPPPPDLDEDAFRQFSLDILNKPKSPEELRSEAERKFEVGVCHLMGLGRSKNAEEGIKCILGATEQGSIRGRAMISTLANSYGIRVDVPDETLKSWLLEAARYGSNLVLHELKHRFQHEHEVAMSTKKFIFDFESPDVLSYDNDILPHFDLSNPELLTFQIDAAKVSLLAGDSTYDSQSAIFNMNFVTKLDCSGNSLYPDRYFIFGTLLHVASLFGFEDAIPILLDANFDIDAHCDNRALRTPLNCALSRGHAQIAKLLIERGANCKELYLWGDSEMCSTPGPLHFLVNIKDTIKAQELARMIVRGGADINYKYQLSSRTGVDGIDYPKIAGKSLTPLRMAVFHDRADLVKVFLGLGAKFAYEKYIRPSEGDESKLPEGYLLLETPTTDLDILEAFFARARIPGLPSEFSQTPLGLLVGEDDGPERRLRPGFENSSKVLAALTLLLDLQPGFEDLVLASAVRHDHLDIVRYMLEEVCLSIESRCNGLTPLQVAVLHGRVGMARFLVDFGADMKAETSKRHLTCLHLLMLMPRDDMLTIDMFTILEGIDVNKKEELGKLTAFHLAVRNKNILGLKCLLGMGADSSLPVTDKLESISEGVDKLLEKVPDRPQIFSALTVLGEVIIEYIQNNIYSINYVTDILTLILDSLSEDNYEQNFVIDQKTGINILHLLSVIKDPELEPRLSNTEQGGGAHDKPIATPPVPPRPQISLLRMALQRLPDSFIDRLDSHGDTPLHYACAASQPHNISALLFNGANPNIRNNFGTRPVDTLAWAVIFLGPRTFRFVVPTHPWEAIATSKDAAKGTNDDLIPQNNLRQSFEALAAKHSYTEPSLETLALAWTHASHQPVNANIERSDIKFMELVPESSFIASTLASNSDVSSLPEPVSPGDDKGVEWSKLKRPYVQMGLKSAQIIDDFDTRQFEYERENELGRERAAL